MPHDPALADRIRDVLSRAGAFTEKKMFGGVGFLIGGNMAAGAHNDGRLMVRCSPGDGAAFLAEPGCEAMVHGGRTMTGWLLVAAPAVEDDADLERWVGRGRAFAASLPPK